MGAMPSMVVISLPPTSLMAVVQEADRPAILMDRACAA